MITNLSVALQTLVCGSILVKRASSSVRMITHNQWLQMSATTCSLFIKVGGIFPFLTRDSTEALMRHVPVYFGSQFQNSEYAVKGKSTTPNQNVKWSDLFSLESSKGNVASFLRNRNILGHWDMFFFFYKTRLWLWVNHNQSQRQSYNMHWTIEHLYRNNSIESQQVKMFSFFVLQNRQPRDLQTTLYKSWLRSFKYLFSIPWKQCTLQRLMA